MKADVLVSILRNGATCTVVARGRKLGEGVPCSGIGRYLRDQLQLEPGTTVAIGVSDEIDRSIIDVVSSDLGRFGYVRAGVMRVGFVTEPGADR